MRMTMACVLLAAPLAALARPAQTPEDADLARQRAQWFYGQRAYPHAHVPAGARLAALAALARLRAADPVMARRALAWKPIGPQPIDTPYTDPVVAGRVTAIAIDPANAAHVYLGGAQGGIWQTTNGGTSWAPLSDATASLAIGSLLLDPANPGTIYAGTGEENFSGDSYYGAGVLKSTDGGASWTQICGPFCGPTGQDGYYGGGARIGSLAIEPGNSQVLLAGVFLAANNANGIYRSADAGAHWTQVLAGNPGTGVLFDPATPGTAYAALGDSFAGGAEGVFLSTDGGQSWAARNGTGATALPVGNAARIVLALAPSAPQTLYASLANVADGSLLGIYKSTDGGATWRSTGAPDYCTPQCSYDNVLAVDPVNPNVVYAGGAFSETLIRSLNGGHSWSVLQAAGSGGFLHADMHALAFTGDGTKLYLGNDGGAYSSANPTAAKPKFTALNKTLSVTQFYPGLAIVPGNPKSAIGGTQDNGTVLYSGTATWKDVTCGDGGYTAIDPSAPATFYATCQQIDIAKSTASGAFGTWAAAQSGIDTNDRVDFIPPLVLDQKTPANLYFGTYRVWQTTNGAGAWQAISPDLTNGPAFWGVITTIAVAPTSSSTVWVGTGDSNVQVTQNALAGAAATWTRVSGAALPPRIITSLAVDPTNAAAAYVGFSGFTGFGDSLGHVFHTANLGAAWTDVSGNLPNVPVNALLINPRKPAQIFAGTDLGVFYSDTAGTTWSPLVDGLPNVAVLGLTFDAATKTLRAATHGRGVWDLNTATLP